MTDRITEKLAAVVADVIDRAAPNQGIEYDVTLTLMPGPQGGPQPVLVVVITMPSPVLGTGLVNTMMIQTLSPEDQQIEDAVRNVIEQLQQGRTAMLAQANGNPGPPQGLSSPSGLILPGQ